MFLAKYVLDYGIDTVEFTGRKEGLDAVRAGDDTRDEQDPMKAS